jgi:hypothetical protein
MQIINSIIHKIEDRAIHLIVDPNSPLSEIKDALIKFMAYINQVEEQVKAQAEQPKPADNSLPIAEPEQPKQE